MLISIPMMVAPTLHSHSGPKCVREEGMGATVGSKNSGSQHQSLKGGKK
jgi:hypothetical protein